MTQSPPPPGGLFDTAEGRRLAQADSSGWRQWGPYLSERQWGTVREDYSEGGTAWDYFPHDHARSRAYRWGEDGIAGFGDDQLNWCMGLALWNGKDPILKERLFGLNNAEGNHGEDVKELYFYLDGTPTHSYMRMLYKYPHAAFPYDHLREENGRRDQNQPEFEILDTGVFEANRYFDVTIEYAKAAADDILMCITVRNRADEPAMLHVLPQLWARNIWSWTEGATRPSLRLEGGGVEAQHPTMPPSRLAADQPVEWLFCENETNASRLFGVEAAGPFKDGINDYIVSGKEEAIRRDKGTRCAAHMRLDLPAKGRATLRLRLRPEGAAGSPFSQFDAIMAERLAEADAFYAVLQKDMPNADARLVQRQALAGMLWSKQFYCFDVRRWLEGDPTQPPPPPARRQGRDVDWQHLNNADIVSMPDKWEYPWYASWDLAFHAVTFALIDPDFAKSQILLLLRDRYMHPNGQKPAYEWAFGDVNPPVHAWAAWRIYQMDKVLMGRGDHDFLRRVLHKLLLNFGWWVNRKDEQNRNIFQGGFLGLDNIEIFDRSAPLPTGGSLSQADGTAWMAGFALDMMRISLELAMEEKSYQDIAVKFFEHFLYITEAMSQAGSGKGLWDDQDAFFYDMLSLPDGQTVPLRVRSLVGLIPLFAVHVLEPEMLDGLPEFAERLDWFLEHRPDLASLISHWNDPGHGERRLLSLLRTHRTRCLLNRMLDPEEFLSDHGIRAVSRYHDANPYIFRHNGESFGIHYLPGESDSRLFGGNSNWRGPVWMPINYLLVEALFEYQRFYGDGLKVEYPTGSGNQVPLRIVAQALAERLAGLSLKGTDGKRPVMAAYPALQDDPDSQDLVLFHEYYHGDTGRGVGASHQTGWSGLVALLLQPRVEAAQTCNVPAASPPPAP
ncbi:MAG TPA: glucosidase [Acetobacteraceae bacterium]|nr:glucosidase [Acetobacteraceae bacterium]